MEDGFSVVKLFSAVEKLANRVDATPSPRFRLEEESGGASGSYMPTPRRALLLCSAEVARTFHHALQAMEGGASFGTLRTGSATRVTRAG